MGWNDFSLPACGERYVNEDGSSRQEELARCEPGEPVALIREPWNPHDRLAVGIYSARRVRVGYLSRERAGWIGSKIDRGLVVQAIVERVKGRSLPGSALGLVIRINMDGEEPEIPDPRQRRGRVKRRPSTSVEPLPMRTSNCLPTGPGEVKNKSMV